MAEKLTELFHCMWRKEAIPQEFKDASIIHLYKRKGNPQVCDNHRGISLLSIAGKILAKILLNRLNAHLDQTGLIPESQCGFRKDRGTIDMIFTARQLQEKCQEQNVDLYMTFVDLTKAFDTVSRDGLWKIMAKFGCPPRFIAMVRQFHDGMQARVQNDGEFSEPFEVTNGVKQGCVLAPTLFSMMFSAMLMDAFQDSDTGFPIRYRFDGNIFNLRRLQAKTKVQTDVLDELLYADDMDKNANTEAKMQRAMDQVSQSCDNYDLTISTKKTEVVHQPAPGKPYNEPTITVNGQKLKVVDNFTYLGSTLSRAVHIDDEITARIAKASVAFGRLRANVWELAQLRWTGHVIRMPDARLPKKVFYGELQEEKRSQGGQKKRYKDTLKASLKDFEIPMGSWEQTAQERSKWRGLINKGAALYEKKRICEAERKRRERKAKTNVPPADSMTLTCSTCNRQFRARIGLVSHQRTHQHTSALFKK